MKILVLPDTQAKYSDNFDFLTCIGKYILAKKPDVVLHLGDFSDMESLSSYDTGKKSFEGRRYTKDIKAAELAMKALMTPLVEFNQKAKKNKEKQYKPRLVMLLGNHENRIMRAVNDDPKLDGLISYDDLPYKKYNWEVHDFLHPVFINGVAFSHYFPTGAMGRPAASAVTLVGKMHMSCIAGHQQGRQVAYGKRPDGSAITAIIAGSCLAKHHKVLTADLRYVELGSVRVGDKLVSFDEHLGMSAKRSRRFKTGTVLNVKHTVGELFDVTLSNGKVFTTTRDHKWLTKNCCGVNKWQETQDLTVNKTKVARVLPEWETLETREAGWLAGMYDGEGSLYARKTTGGNCTQLAISQCPVHNPTTVERLIKAHQNLGFDLGNHCKNGKNCRQWRIPRGQAQVAKFLGSVRPQRLLDKFKPELLGTLTTKYAEPLDTVVSVASKGLGTYVEIEIDAATMVVEGYPHHNCYEHDEGYLDHQSNHHWRGIIMLHEVENGSFDEMFVSLKYLKEKYATQNNS
jgi:hypothetical protein